MVHCPQGGSVQAGLLQPLLLSFNCIKGTRRKAVYLGSDKNTGVVSAKKMFEVISRFLHSCSSEVSLMNVLNKIL